MHARCQPRSLLQAISQQTTSTGFKVEKELPLMMQTCMIKYNGIFILLEKSVIFGHASKFHLELKLSFGL